MKIYHNPLQTRADLKELNVAVYGLGKMGLPLAAVLADNGASVKGVDIDEEVVESVNHGVSPVDNEPGLQELVEQHAGDGLRATTDGVEAARDADVSIVLVPILLDDDKQPDLELLRSVGTDISSGVEAGNLVILESTVPPGTTENELVQAVEPDGLEAGTDFGVAHCPERTSSGTVIKDLTESYPKIVGGIDPESTRSAASIYRVFNEPGVIEMSSARAAEAVKVFEGVYRDVNIALANELAKACEEWELDSSEVIDAANTQPYCDIHEPGVGVGGHCIPVYTHFVIGGGGGTPLLRAAREVNDGMPKHTVDLLESLLEVEGRGLGGSTVLVLGLTYRPGVRETRYAPALDVIDLLQESGANVYAHDPLLTDDEISSFGATPVESPLTEGLDAVVLATGHSDYRDLDLAELRRKMRTPVLVDGRDFFEPQEMTDFTYAAIGKARKP